MNEVVIHIKILKGSSSDVECGDAGFLEILKLVSYCHKGCVLLFICSLPVDFDEAFIFYVTDVQRHLQLLQFGNWWPYDRWMLCWVHTGYKIPVQAYKSVCLKPRAGGTWKEFGFPWKPFNWTNIFLYEL